MSLLSKSILGLLFIFLSINFCSAQESFEKNQLIVMVKPGQSIHQILEFQNRNQSFHFEVKKVLSQRLRIYLLETQNSSIDSKKQLGIFESDERIEIAQLNHNNVTRRNTVPNDLNYPAQWSLNTTATAHIYAPQAWDISTDGLTVDGDTIVMAVVDGGADLNHVDLHFFKNKHEIPNNGLDDDGNGYIDDYDGWNAYNSDGNIGPDSHGTHVSGIVGAKTNNSNGIAGVVWDGAIMPIAASSGLESIVLEGYGYMLEQRLKYNESNGDSGAFVVASNSSFGVDFGQPADYPIWCAFYDSLGAAGILNMGATINQLVDVDIVGDVPTTCPSNHLISVTNIRNNTNLVAGYGKIHIDLGAPGTQIYSTIPNQNYGNKTGTSMATPHVTGVIGAMYSAMCSDQLTAYKSNPDSVSLWVAQVLLAATDSTGSLNGKTLTDGRLNMFEALKGISNNNCSEVSSQSTMDSCGLCTGEINITVDGDHPPYQIVSLDSLPSQNDSVFTDLCESIYFFEITDSTGFTYVDSVIVNGNEPLSLTYTVSPATDSLSSDGVINVQTAGGVAPYSYLWNTGDTTSSLTGVLPGEYMVTIKDSLGCLYTQSIIVYTVGIQNLQVSNLKIYPNPSTGVFFIQGLTNQNHQVNIIDLSGKLVFSTKLAFGENRINPSLSNGIYLIKIEGYSIQKLVIQD